METLTDRFIKTIAENDSASTAVGEIVRLVFEKPDTPEKFGLRAYLFHEGIGVPADMEMCVRLAEKAAFEYGDPLGYFLLGYMADGTDDRRALEFYEKCAGTKSRWGEQARLWLGRYFADIHRGNDIALGLEYFRSIAEDNSEAAGWLSDYYWSLVVPDYLNEDDWKSELFRWTSSAARLDPAEYSWRLGLLYADGIGCEKDTDKAVDYLEEACDYDDWRAARSLADMLSDVLKNNPDMSPEEKAECESAIREWNAWADEQREAEIKSEHDRSVEED
ncbi:MAG: sel1 repeat family protein [Muribaculaceae bacterium]|nr:sel1 repeat family protein [Muribaculaceae bacterium]